MSESVAGTCPACGRKSLFLGSGGWVTCSTHDCPAPTLVADMLDQPSAAGSVFVAQRLARVHKVVAEAASRIEMRRAVVKPPTPENVDTPTEGGN